APRRGGRRADASVHRACDSVRLHPHGSPFRPNRAPRLSVSYAGPGTPDVSLSSGEAAMYGLLVASTLAGLSPAGPPARPGWEVEVGLTAAQVGERTAAQKARGYRPIGVSAYNSGEANRFAVIYRVDTGPAWDMDWGLTPKQFQRRGR